jgi:hypothetical protein
VFGDFEALNQVKAPPEINRLIQIGYAELLGSIIRFR